MIEFENLKGKKPKPGVFVVADICTNLHTRKNNSVPLNWHREFKLYWDGEKKRWLAPSDPNGMGILDRFCWKFYVNSEDDVEDYEAPSDVLEEPYPIQIERKGRIKTKGRAKDDDDYYSEPVKNIKVSLAEEDKKRLKSLKEVI